MEFEYHELCLKDIEGLSTNTDDFLSNGFHQFYNEFQDEQLDFETQIDTTTWEGYVPDDHDYHKNGWMDMSGTHIDYSENSHTTLDLDYILMDLPYENNQNLLDLPEKTPLCNDSCSFFLKESAENLKLLNSPPAATVIDVPPQNTSNDEESPDNSTSSSNDLLKPLLCDFKGCGKSYAKPTHLKAHLKRHLNEKPYICHWPECTWRFSRSDELARHRRSHLGIKPYNCCFCSKSFARSDHLTKHRRVHEKKFNAMCKGERQTIVWPAVPRGRPGRKPKAKVTVNDSNENNSMKNLSL